MRAASTWLSAFERADLMDRIEQSTDAMRDVLDAVSDVGQAAVATVTTLAPAALDPDDFDAEVTRTAPDGEGQPTRLATDYMPDTVLADADKAEFHFADCACDACCDVGRFDDDPGATSADGGGAAGGTANDPPLFTTDQIADQLTLGYWQATSGGGERAFDVGPGGTLNVDITGLQASGQAMAREALDAWTRVTGITFNEVDSLPEPDTWIVENADAATLTGTAYSMQVGQGFRGTLTVGDRDAIAVDLVAGQTYTVALAGDDSGGTGLFDPYLRVYNPSGTLIALNDDADGFDSRLSFTATTSGRYYLQAGAFQDAEGGDYEMRIGSGQTHILFGDQESGAYAQSSTIGSTVVSSFINVNWNWTGGENRIDSYHFQTYMHEIGHALGLGHAGNYNGSATFGTDNHYQNDSWAVSLMSYFHQTENPYTSSSFAYAITPMMADILAIQNLYGIPDHATGDTTYGRGGDSGTYLDGSFELSRPTAFTVFDTGGTDHFDFSGYAQGQRMDLRDETWSDLAGLVDNVAISRGTVIENGTTGSGHDDLTGNDAANALWAGAGDDVARGGGGDDALFGGAGADTLMGGDGRDLIEGGDGADVIEGGSGDDVVFGDGVTLAGLEELFPTWTPPADAQARIDAGEIHILWQDILADVYGVA